MDDLIDILLLFYIFYRSILSRPSQLLSRLVFSHVATNEACRAVRAAETERAAFHGKWPTSSVTSLETSCGDGDQAFFVIELGAEDSTTELYEKVP